MLQYYNTSMKLLVYIALVRAVPRVLVLKSTSVITMTWGIYKLEIFYFYKWVWSCPVHSSNKVSTASVRESSYSVSRANINNGAAEGTCLKSKSTKLPFKRSLWINCNHLYVCPPNDKLIVTNFKRLSWGKVREIVLSITLINSQSSAHCSRE